MTPAEQLTAARKAVIAAHERLDRAVRLRVSDLVRTTFPGATGYTSYGEHVGAGAVIVRLLSIERPGGKVEEHDEEWDFELADEIRDLLTEAAGGDAGEYLDVKEFPVLEVPQSLPLHLEETGRPELPTLWGVAEMTLYANLVRQRLGKDPLGRGRAWTWYRIEGFPQAAVTVQMGSLYAADEVAPFIEERMSVERHLTTPIPAEVKAEILAAKGTMSQAAIARAHGVSVSMVAKVHREGVA